MNFPRLRESDEKRRQLRRYGFADGYQGKPARSVLAEYQVSYRRGREARAASERGDVA